MSINFGSPVRARNTGTGPCRWSLVSYDFHVVIQTLAMHVHLNFDRQSSRWVRSIIGPAIMLKAWNEHCCYFADKTNLSSTQSQLIEQERLL